MAPSLLARAVAVRLAALAIAAHQGTWPKVSDPGQFVADLVTPIPELLGVTRPGHEHLRG